MVGPGTPAPGTPGTPPPGTPAPGTSGTPAPGTPGTPAPGIPAPGGRTFANIFKRAYLTIYIYIRKDFFVYSQILANIC